MNANELADELTELIVSPTPVDDKWACELIDNAATMLRQQQAEIEALKNRNWDLVSEPWGFDRHLAKELTDEEIEEVEKSCKQPLASWAWQIDFAKAILRKAQEK